MKVLMLNGSLKANGNTNAILEAVGKQLNQEGIDYEIFQMGNDAVRDCAGCGQCSDKGCVYDDDKVNEFVGKLKEADGLIVGTPVLTTLCAGMEEMLGKNNEYGIIVENSEEGLYKGLKDVLQNPDKISYYKEKAKERGKIFSTDKTVNAVQDMLLNLLK